MQGGKIATDPTELQMKSKVTVRINREWHEGRGVLMRHEPDRMRGTRAGCPRAEGKIKNTGTRAPR